MSKKDKKKGKQAKLQALIGKRNRGIIEHCKLELLSVVPILENLSCVREDITEEELPRLVKRIRQIRKACRKCKKELTSTDKRGEKK